MNRVIRACVVVNIVGSTAWADYVPSAYPPVEPVITDVRLTTPDRLSAGGPVRIRFQVTAKSPVRSPARLFLHLVRDDKVYHVAVLPGGRDAIPADRFVPGRAIELGPFETTLPTDLSGGAYKLVGGVYREPTVAEKLVTIMGPADNGPAGSRSHTEEDRFPQPPLIINTGTFSDKFGTP
ncbi:MAG: hypothetical protein HY718_11305, partial [Planctomycetes bacterium]|nr:hypothetical protein [Planctomycetota bacterium]